MRPRILLGLTLLLASPSARAQPVDPEGLVTHGIELREQGHDDQALLEFRRALVLAPTPRTRAQVGLAEQALGMWVAADADLREAVKAEADPWIARHRATLVQSLGAIAQHLGSLEVRGGVAGAEVFVDGASLGALPLAEGRRVEAGTRTLEVRAKGYYTTSRTVVVPPGGIARETIELRAQPAAEPPPPARLDAASPATPRSTASHVEDAPSGNGQRTLGWIFVGTGVTLLATGILAQVVRQSTIASYNGDKACPGIDSPTQPAGCDSKVSTASTWQTISIASFIAGGAFGLGGVAIVVTAPTRAGGSASLTYRAVF